MLAAVALVACAPDPRDAERCREAGFFGGTEQVARAERAPGGVGWCCPRDLPFTAAYLGYTGGFVEDPCECGARWVADAPPCAYHPYTDSFGCEAYSVSRSSGCGIPADSGSRHDDAGSVDRDAGALDDAS